jgi:hypothetical protein
LRTKWPILDTALAVKRKLREAPENVLRYFCLWAALALAKPAPKATPLFQFAGFFYWKARKSPNKQALKQETPLEVSTCGGHQNTIKGTPWHPF